MYWIILHDNVSYFSESLKPVGYLGQDITKNDDLAAASGVPPGLFDGRLLGIFDDGKQIGNHIHFVWPIKIETDSLVVC